MSNLNARILSGLSWNVGELVFGNGLSYVVKLILARLLLPEHFGIIGMAIVFTGLVTTVSDLGLASVLIQFKKERLDRAHLNTAFWASLAFNIAVFAILSLIIAPLAAWFYGERILGTVIPVIGISAVLHSASLVHRVILTRELRFKHLGIAQVLAHFVSGTGAIILALKGAGVWSLAFQSVFLSVVSIPLLWYFARWRPRKQFSVNALRDILGLSIYEMGQKVFNYLTRNIDYLLIGKMLGAVPLGIYTLAFVITDTFRQQMMNLLNRVMFPVYGQLQDDPRSIKTYYLHMVRFNVTLILPFMLPLIFFTEPIVQHAFGLKWSAAVFPIQALAVAAIVHAVGGTTDSVIRGIGRFDLSFKIITLKALLFNIPILVIGIYYYGINGAAVAVVLNKLVGRLVWQFFMCRLLDVREKDILLALKAPLFGCLLAIPSALAIKQFASLADITSVIAAALAVAFVFCISVFPLHKEELRFLLNARKCKYEQ